MEWTDATWNPVTGCTKVSPRCDHCYAERITERFHGKGSFEKIQLHPQRLDQPIRWKRPRRIFVNSMSDLFHPYVPDLFIAKVWATMISCEDRHIFQVLTKRPRLVRDSDGLSGDVVVGAVTDHYGDRLNHFRSQLLRTAVSLGSALFATFVLTLLLTIRDFPYDIHVVHG
jgi:protein gp37